MQIKEGGGQVSFYVKDYDWGCGIFASLILGLTLISVSIIVIASSCISILGDDSGGVAGMTAPAVLETFSCVTAGIDMGIYDTLAGGGV